MYGDKTFPYEELLHKDESVSILQAVFQVDCERDLIILGIS